MADVFKKVMLYFLNGPAKMIGFQGTVPLPLVIIICCLHHPLAMLLVVPMNLKYSVLVQYHRIVTSLLLAAGVCFVSGQYKFTLDVSKKSGFIQFKFIVLLQLVTILFTRGLLWFTQMPSALHHFYIVGDTSFLVGGAIGGVLMSLFNVIMILDATTAAVKWLPKPMPTEGSDEHGELLTDMAANTLIPLPFGGSEKSLRVDAKVLVAALKFKKGAKKH